MTAADDHRSRPRRRGEALDVAILEAALEELTEVGYAGLTMERVAERARTGKASLYRRWPTRMELTLDAVRQAMPDPASPPDTGAFRTDVLECLRENAALLAGPAGQALRGLLGDAMADQERMRALRRGSQGSGVTAMTEIARRAVARGEIDPAAVTPARLGVAHAMLRQHFLFDGTVIGEDDLAEIVDDVVVPLFAPRR
ncbi:TetR/AcrR family transcriptional regulator [Microbacterium cremeum]|uniref:TetR/AcrR family transcriptional regulator n=1 Tax=Microbacterium cremeum TaxID=2782169 RepID=UPI0018889A25|nr:TetR/AcrR family transcriptional regulator [Microbacterium cremeum]